ncbi:sulfurtransferase TusA family protein [Pannonibacter tanglangensis]|uniref:Response regulator SirA n=1 Tax=Pannonibacter tanglangensis TaxID=2750084 RepID=A0ABW9ZN13_9HYPH|nr:sulfurtransferase TusA family protein [Pannonibacter sp. XCT-34]NBN65488.1 response regulator SirA [Pannonibacter sp. XCT-34]
MASDTVLDLRGLKCPLPVLRTRQALRQQAAGARLVVEATDPMSAIDIPHMCNEDGHRLVAQVRDGELIRFTIEKRAAS